MALELQLLTLGFLISRESRVRENFEMSPLWWRVYDRHNHQGNVKGAFFGVASVVPAEKVTLSTGIFVRTESSNQGK